MKKILIGAFVLWPVLASAQVGPAPPGGITPPIFGLPAQVSGGSPISGSLIPTQDNTFDLGSSSFQWRSAYLGTSLILADAGLVQFGTTTPPTLLREGADRLIQRRGTAAERFDVANTYTSATNNELFSVDWQSQANNAVVGTRTGSAGGTQRGVFFSAQAASGSNAYVGLFLNAGNAQPIRIGNFSTAIANISQTSYTTLVSIGEGTNTATSGTFVNTAILPTYNQASGTAANTDLLINRTQTAVGSGAQLLWDAQVSGVSQASLSNVGLIDVGTAGGYSIASRFAAATAPSGPVACSSPTVTWSNGTAAFQIDVGTTCAGISTLVVTLPAAANAWSCVATNTTTSATAEVEMTASTSTSATFTNYTRTTGIALTWVDGADIRISCLGG